jgi:hypothetical protein
VSRRRILRALSFDDDVSDPLLHAFGLLLVQIGVLVLDGADKDSTDLI